MCKGGEDLIIVFLSIIVTSMFILIVILTTMLADSNAQVKILKASIEELNEQVQEHEEIMRTYEFFNKQWEKGAYTSRALE